MDIQFMKDYYDLRYEETDGENHFVDEAAYQEKQSEHSKMEDQLMEMVGGTESKADLFAVFIERCRSIMVKEKK